MYKPWWCALRVLEGTHIVGPKAGSRYSTDVVAGTTTSRSHGSAQWVEKQRIQLHIGLAYTATLERNGYGVPVLVADLGTLQWVLVGGSSGAVASEGGERVAAERVGQGVVKMEHRVYWRMRACKWSNRTSTWT